MRAFAASVLVLLALAGCRLLSGEVACSRSRDCPRDAGLDYCDAPGDGGVGTCVPTDPNPPEASDAGGDVGDGGFFDFLDAG